ncbi:MAG: BREX-1 system phosphatase PglZ type B [Elusimicrobia bacterium]|nr:BREX-1 system phosphatase PglZ type B [Elusimicrobiota bacterium]
MTQTEREHTTLIEALQKSLSNAGRNAPGEVQPVAILWPDADGQWQPLVEQLRRTMPELLVYGAYTPEQRQGPAIWLRCIIERALAAPALPEKRIPIVYMPKITRQILRAVDECPESLRPLVELQYRGVTWCQRNGRDWTVEAFLVSEESGLGLDVAKDDSTRRAMRGSLPQLAVTSLLRLRGKRLEAEDFDKLMVEDTPRNLLEWLSEPREARERWDHARWTAFCSRCKAEYGFDPERDGEIVAGEKLGLLEDAWTGVWDRFVEAPSLYPGIPSLLRKAKPAILTFKKETWPDENDTAENNLREALCEFTNLPPAEARTTLTKLEIEHAPRRQWVWTQLGMSPLAKSLEYLTTLSERTVSSLGGDSPKTMADLYAQGAYLADDSVLRALAEVRSAEDWRAVSAVIHAIYMPWLQDAAEHFQKLVAANPLPTHDNQTDEIIAESGTCILFVDGLRFDLGVRLSQLSQEHKLRITQNRRWAALPTVTATAKPAVSPIHKKIVGHRLAADFAPEIQDAGQPLISSRFKDMVIGMGFQWLSETEIGKPFNADAKAWTEYGEFDKLGHTMQAKLATQVSNHLELLINRIDSLIDAGWKQVRVVTDHGWLMVPSGLPSMVLPKYLVESRWSRCATIKPEAHVPTPMSHWYWNTSEVFAYASGAHCFGNGIQYAHGGISIQECLLPDLIFQGDAAVPDSVSRIVDVQWVKMRCRVVVEPFTAGMTVDIRTKASDAASSLASPKPVDSDGRAGLLIEDDTIEGTTASVVLLDVSGRVMAKRPTIIGGED